MDIIQNIDLIQSTIKWLSKNRKFHICIHDLSGIFHQSFSLKLPKNNTIHSCTFCEFAKSTSGGLRFCLKCKELSLKKALNSQQLFIGNCYLGITEIIKPIFHNNKPLCVVYLGNITLTENGTLIREKIDRISCLTRVNSEHLHKALNTTEQIDSCMLSEYSEIVEIISNSITQTINNNTKIHRKSVSTLPSYRSTNHWIIELIQNYISSYYNRNLQLSQLAKLYFLNPQYLCRLFKKETGKNFSDYVNEIRIEKAKQLLIVTEYNIVDIALEVGYANVTYFNRLFKNYTGVTPRNFRSQKSI